MDYAGPPAVKSLLEDGYRVVAQASEFKDAKKREDYQTHHSGAVPSGIQEPKKLIQHVWDNHKKVDVLVSNDSFPAIHAPIDVLVWNDAKMSLRVFYRHRSSRFSKSSIILTPYS